MRHLKKAFSLLVVAAIPTQFAFSDNQIQRPQRKTIPSIPSKTIKVPRYCTDLRLTQLDMGCDSNCSQNDAKLVTSITLHVVQNDPNTNSTGPRCNHRAAPEYETTIKYVSYLTGKEEILSYRFSFGQQAFVQQQALDRKIFFIPSKHMSVAIKPIGDFSEYKPIDNTVEGMGYCGTHFGPGVLQ